MATEVNRLLSVGGREVPPFGIDELQKLQDAWARTVQLHLTLWSRPYVKDGLW